LSPLVATYRVDVPGSVRFLVAALLALLSIVGFVALFLALANPTSPAWLFVVCAVWLSGVLLGVLQVLSFPTRLELGADGVASFICPTRIVRVPLASIRGVRRAFPTFILVHHDKGTVRIPARLTNLGDFLTRVKAASTRAVVDAF
jgi:hypothetical protein